VLTGRIKKYGIRTPSTSAAGRARPRVSAAGVRGAIGDHWAPVSAREQAISCLAMLRDGNTLGDLESQGFV